MSNLTWKKIWKDVINDFNNLNNLAPDPLFFGESVKSNNLFIKKSNNLFIKKSNNTFKTEKNKLKNINDFSISLKDEKYKNDSSKWKQNQLELFKKFNESNKIIDFKLNTFSLKYLITINNFIDKITKNDVNYLPIINNDCKVLTETIFDLFKGLKKYNDIYKKFKKNFFNNKKIFNSQLNLKQNEKILVDYKNFILECKENISSIFDDRVELYKSFYSLLEKIYWEYLNFNLPENLKQKFENDFATKLFLNNFLKDNFDKYKYWIVSKYDEVNELVFFKKQKTLLKEKYDNHVLIL